MFRRSLRACRYRECAVSWCANGWSDPELLKFRIVDEVVSVVRARYTLAAAIAELPFLNPELPCSLA